MAKKQFVMPEGDVVERDMPEWKTPWNYNREFESERTALFCPDPSLTKQEFKEDSDINVILERFMRGAQQPEIVLPEHFADLTGRTTYYDIATKTAEANALFYLLPANKRAEFLNDPTRWADAVVTAVNMGNAELLNELGIDATEKPLAGEPPTGGTPAPITAGKPPEASKTGDTPEPPSDKAKK